SSLKSSVDGGCLPLLVGCLSASSSSLAGAIFFPASLEADDRAKAVSRKTCRPTVVRSPRKIRKSELVSRRDPTVFKLAYALEIPVSECTPINSVAGYTHLRPYPPSPWPS